MTNEESESMAEQWTFFPCTMGDDQAFIYLNVAWHDSIGQLPDNLAKLRLEYKSPNPNGLPTNEEFEPVGAIEDQIEAHVATHDDRYVGRVTVAGHRFFYIYTNRNEEEWSRFVGELCQSSGYDIRLAHTSDPEHRGYLDDLYPTPNDWQVIRDLQVLENLEKHGDDGSAPRRVDHWAYFPDQASAVAFVAWAQGDRFEEDADASHVTEDGKHCVRLFHHGAVRIHDISSHTIALANKATELGGEYDGWETVVVASEAGGK